MNLSIFFPLLVAVFAGIGDARSVPKIDVCRLPAHPGSCRAGLPRYYYDAKEGKCKFFAYGGCGGNANRFLSQEECENACTMKKEECPKVCPFIYDPVCGSDGKTYPSPCALGVEACNSGEEIHIEHEGECETKDCDKACTYDYRPVCGSDGKTYANLCGLEIATCESDGKITLAHEGECEKNCDKPCPRIYQPVCGSDGNTYSNTCVMDVEACRQNEDISVEHKGECDDEKPQNK